MIGVYINGITGNMGQIAKRAIEKTTDIQVVGGGYTSNQMYQEANKNSVDVVIDLTSSEVIMQHIPWLIEQGKPILIGTSGITAERQQLIRSLVDTHGTTCWVVPNFSIGANLMMQFSALAAKYYNTSLIIERHHSKKKDAPSQTALHTAHMIQTNTCHTKIESIRNDDYIAEQTVTFTDHHEELIIEHKSHNRENFAAGIISCLRKIPDLQGFHYGMQINTK